MTENPPPPSGTPEGDGSTPPPPPNPYGSQPSTSPSPPPNPYASQPPPPSDPYAGNPPAAGQNPYGAEAYPVGPGGPAPVAGAQPGPLLPRFLARLVDGLILLVVDVVVVLLTNSVIAGVIGGILYLGYYAYLESSRGRTFGKQVLNLRVVGSSGGNPTIEESLRRNAWAALSIIGGLGVIGQLAGLLQFVAVIAIAVTISSDPLKRGWHDKFANTTVTKEG